MTFSVIPRPYGSCINRPDISGNFLVGLSGCFGGRRDKVGGYLARQDQKLVNDPEKSSDNNNESDCNRNDVPEGKQSAETPQHHKMPGRYIYCAKQVFLNFVWRPVERVVQWLDSHDGLLTALATVAIAALTFVLAIYAGHQEEILNRQNRTFEDTQRAFVVPTDLAIERHVEWKTKKFSGWVASAVLSNTGNTTTRNMRYAVGYIIADPAEFLAKRANDPDAAEVRFTNLPDIMSLGPKASSQIAHIFIIDKQLDLLRADKLRMFVVGQAVYSDVFGQEHETKFCYRLYGLIGGEEGYRLIPDVIKPVQVYSTGELSARMCRHNNCEDKECGAPISFENWPANPSLMTDNRTIN